MDAWLLIAGVIGVLLWLLHGAQRSRLDEARQEADAIDETMRENHLADTDTGIDQRVRDKYGNR